MTVEDHVVLQTKDITKRFGGNTAVAGVSVRLREGEILGLIGPNGAGKSTFFNLVSGVIRPDEGTVALYGRDTSGRKPSSIAKMGLVRTFQHQSIFRDLSVRDNLLMAAMGSKRRREANRAADSALEFTGLKDWLGVRAWELPHGHERLLGLGLAYASGAGVVCLDEPLAGLNASESDVVLDNVRRMRAEGRSILFVEHNVRAVMALCDRIVVMDEGRTIADDVPGEIQRNPLVIAAYLGESS